MKKTNVSKAVLMLLVSGLLLTSVVPVVNRYYPMPDALNGFFMGMGLAIEVLALIKMDKNRKKMTCG
ncbi:hypothetical protein [Pedobacter duraquae]|uniref:Uncharacterized protein n=1 Tax=Pedobacter duraquae TaxID=425511 RepID=A0A4R6IGJ5_9SPHI|nr:hypothetical protein [Pedobacter duraquae]TDO20848.1 hypothetical protein CLV32_3482 [Pedobacter duraquae]